MTAKPLIPLGRIGERILLLRGQKVMLDYDLAELYGVPTKRLNEQVRRNKSRFPSDFMFQLAESDVRDLRSQIATSSSAYGGRRYRPYAFTEQGVAMLSSVLHSDRAIQVNIAIMRAFVQLRQWLASHADIERKLQEMEQKYDEQFQAVFETIRQLMTPPAEENDRKIGFQLE
jgi:hypothetical protein